MAIAGKARGSIMGLLEKIRNYISGLEERELYRYVTLFIGTVILCVGIVVFYHYRTVSGLRKQIRSINRMREDDVQDILSKATYIQKQQHDIDELLAQDKYFSLKEYLNRILGNLNLTKKELKRTPIESAERQDQYSESILKVNFHDMDMKQVSELIKEFEEEPRIFIKDLEIVRSEKMSNKLDVTITIGTFLLKTE